MKYYLVLFLYMPLAIFTNLHEVGEFQNNQIVDSKSVVDHAQWTALLSKYVTKDGQVNYDGFKDDEKSLQDYLENLKNNSPLESWSKNEKLAYWINAYNAFTIKLILDHYPVKSIRDIKDPWDIEFIDIADKTYSLGTIEHEILRKMNEPRIHFAINCASYSCPDLLNQAYTARLMETQLEVASNRFVNDTSKNSISKDEIEISKIFEWFAEDFEKQGTLIDFLNRYSVVKINALATISYKDYNWSLND